MMKIKSALILAGLILALAFGLNLADDGGFIESSTTDRVMGTVTGLVLVIFANAMPKNLGPLSESRCGLGRGQNLRRFAAWTLVLAGLGHAIVWLTFPIDLAPLVAKVIVASGLVLVAGAFLVGAHRGAHSPTES